LRQPWRAILSVLNRSLTGKDTSWDTARLPILQLLWGIVHSANLDFASLIWDEFEWQAVDITTKPTKMSKLLYTRFTKLIIDHFLSCNKNVPRRSDFEMHSEGQDLHLTKLINTIKGTYKFGMNIPDTMINDAFKKSARYKYYKAKKAESEKAKSAEEPEEQHVSPVKSRQGKGYMHSDTDEEKDVETVDSDDSDMDLSDDNPQGHDDAVGFGVFMYNKSTEPLKSTYLSPTVTCSSLEYIQSMLNETPVHELTDLMSNPVYTDAHITSIVANPEGNPEATSYILGSSEVPFGTHVDVHSTNLLLQEMFSDETTHQLSSPPANTTSYPTTNP
ncbi:hypothetical protein Tco_0609209, partial [Tanacetum coccineum]